MTARLEFQDYLRRIRGILSVLATVLNGQGSRPDFGVVKGSSLKILWVKILTSVAGGSTGAYVVSPLEG